LPSSNVAARRAHDRRCGCVATPPTWRIGWLNLIPAVVARVLAPKTMWGGLVHAGRVLTSSPDLRRRRGSRLVGIRSFLDPAGIRPRRHARRPAGESGDRRQQMKNRTTQIAHGTTMPTREIQEMLRIWQFAMHRPKASRTIRSLLAAKTRHSELGSVPPWVR
jgi:hypothetical protein